MSIFAIPAVKRFAYPSTPGPLDPTRTRMVLELRHANPLLSCRFDPSGRFVFAGTQDNTIQRWELANQRKVALVGHRSWIRALAFSGQKLISGDYAGKVIHWQLDAELPAAERTVDTHRGWVRAIAVSPDGRTYATCGNDNLVKLWNLDDGSLIREYAGHQHHVYNVAFHPSGQHLVSGDLRGVVKHWEVSTGRETRTLDASVLFRYDPTFRADHGGIRSMSFNRDGSLLACGGITNVTNAFAGIGNPAIVLFHWESGRAQGILRPAAAFQGTCWGVDFHPTGFIAGVGGGSGGTLWFWRPNTQTPAAPAATGQPTPPPTVPSFHALTLPNNARDLHLHPDGRRLAIPFFDGAVRIYEMA